VSDSDRRRGRPSSAYGVAAPVRSAVAADRAFTRALVDSVSDCLRTPLAVVSGHAELLSQHEHELPAEVHQSLVALRRAARRLDDVVVGVRDLVDIACVPLGCADAASSRGNAPVLANPLPGLASDVTELKRVERALRRQALYDPLTGLPNRTLLQDRLDQAKERHARDLSASVAVAFLDVDQFKLVNDAMGHAVGDRLLRQLAGRLRVAARPGETVTRFGGDEFVVLADGLSSTQAHAMAKRMLAVLDKPFDIGGLTVHVTASVGIASSEVCPPEELLQAADAAMYVAKRRGCGETQMFDAALAAQSRTRFELNAELRSALSEEELELWYQPIVEIGSGRLLGIEALARWDHRTRGFVSPDLFVSVAEQGGFVRNLDRWALRRAAAELAELRAGGHVAPDVYVSVNVSALHLARGDLWAAVSEAVSLADLPHGCLNLEVTETAVLADPESASAVLRRIADAGFGVALDDFGTGYSSLSYLRSLPVTRVKIDRSFVVDAAQCAVDRTICASVVALCRDLGIQAIAEGVETQAQHDMLQELGCLAGQGYRWGKPMDREALSAWLAAGR
jgi:diguanylate cyclase (GGDEF)-like protein